MAGLPAWIVREDRAAVPAGARPAPNSAHAVLGLRAGAPLTEIKRAFRAQAQIHHPDKGGKTENFVALKRAYESLIAKHEARSSTRSSTSPRGARAKRAAAKAARPPR